MKKRAIARQRRYGLACVRRLCKQLAWSYSSRLSLLVRDLCASSDDDHQWLCHMVSLSADPLAYRDAREYALDAQLLALVSKLEFSCRGLDPENEALRRFEMAEAMCRETNSRLLRDPTGRVSDVIHRARKMLSTWLHDMPRPSLLAWGPGATSAVSGEWTGHNNKIRANPDLTLDLLTVFEHWLLELMPDHHPSVFYKAECEEAGPFSVSINLRKQVRWNVVNSTTVAYVPKTAKTHRTIGIEPHLNVAVQRMVGKDIRRRLKRVGLDLDHQADTQRKLAREGSISGELATLDLTMASDTLASRLIDVLLPPSWARLLGCIRTPSYIHPRTGEVCVYHKHSSMGNGYTWELESMIFYALTLASCHSVDLCNPTVGVFGDDIIAPIEAVPLLTEVLEYCGFKLNAEKSFSHGPFRESCGHDYFDGVPVRPVYLRSLSRDGLATLLSQLSEKGAFLDDTMTSFLDLLCKDVEVGSVVPWVPPGVGGGVVTDNPLLWTTRYCSVTCRLLVRHRRFKASKRIYGDDLVTPYVVLSDLAFRSKRGESSVQLDTARKAGRWSYGWAPFGHPAPTRFQEALFDSLTGGRST